MNATVHLLRKCLGATVHLRAEIAEEHPSASLLGTERAGTGVVVGSGGAIVTAHYLLIGASSVQVVWLDGTTLPGQVAGIDYATGLGAVVVDVVPHRGLTVRALDTAQPGEEVFVIASNGDGRRVSTGFITSVGPFDAFWEYFLERAILASAENPGFSGGPMLDAHGQVLGIASLSLLEIGKCTLAVPASLAAPMLDRIRDGGRYATAVERPWLGVTCYSLRNHVVVSAVFPNAPAATAGLRAGDVIVAVDGQPVAERRELFVRLWQRRSGEPIALRVFRNNQTVDLDIVTGSIEAFFAKN